MDRSQASTVVCVSLSKKLLLTCALQLGGSIGDLKEVSTGQRLIAECYCIPFVFIRALASDEPIHEVLLLLLLMEVNCGALNVLHCVTEKKRSIAAAGNLFSWWWHFSFHSRSTLFYSELRYFREQRGGRGGRTCHRE